MQIFSRNLSSSDSVLTDGSHSVLDSITSESTRESYFVVGHWFKLQEKRRRTQNAMTRSRFAES